MKLTTISHALAAAAALVAASSALASGEPKNAAPFTRAFIVERAPVLALTVRHAVAGHSLSGEAKDQVPFTRPASIRLTAGHVASATLSATGMLPIQGESKSEAPFTSPAGEEGSLALALRATTRLVAAETGGKPAKTPGFTRGASAVDTVESERFSWAEAGLSAVATVGICLTCLGGVSARRGAAVAKSLESAAGRN
jgi:hypothetical protein